jgi:hypothetical protein
MYYVKISTMTCARLFFPAVGREAIHGTLPSLQRIMLQWTADSGSSRIHRLICESALCPGGFGISLITSEVSAPPPAAGAARGIGMETS